MPEYNKDMPFAIFINMLRDRFNAILTTSQFIERLKAVGAPPPPSHPPATGGSPAAILDLLHSINWPQSIAPEIAGWAGLPRSFLLEIWNWTSQRSLNLSWLNGGHRNSTAPGEKALSVMCKKRQNNVSRRKRKEERDYTKWRQGQLSVLGPSPSWGLWLVSDWAIEIGVFLY